jgi:hypothetical protein
VCLPHSPIIIIIIIIIISINTNTTTITTTTINPLSQAAHVSYLMNPKYTPPSAASVV